MLKCSLFKLFSIMDKQFRISYLRSILGVYSRVSRKSLCNQYYVRDRVQTLHELAILEEW
nr:MAG: hypothetical protein [Microvirus sp.]